jgi:hypothetical protein
MSMTVDQRLLALLRWLHHDFGIHPAPMPKNHVIADRLGIKKSQTLCNLLRRAKRDRLLEIRPQPDRSRICRVLPAGCDLAAARVSRSPVPAATAPQTAAFAAWVYQAVAGEQRVYFVGHLAEARGLPPSKRSKAMSIALLEAQAASEAAQRGEVTLCTRRSSEVVEYIAIRTRAAA